VQSRKGAKEKHDIGRSCSELQLVIPAKDFDELIRGAGIQFSRTSWMPDQVRHDRSSLILSYRLCVSRAQRYECSARMQGIARKLVFYF
jgi:hypothetical protein